MLAQPGTGVLLLLGPVVPSVVTVCGQQKTHKISGAQSNMWFELR